MKLSTAMLCLDCEQIFEGDVCPCSSKHIVPISRWIPAKELYAQMNLKAAELQRIMGLYEDTTKR